MYNLIIVLVFFIINGTLADSYVTLPSGGQQIQLGRRSGQGSGAYRTSGALQGAGRLHDRGQLLPDHHCTVQLDQVLSNFSITQSHA